MHDNMFFKYPSKTFKQLLLFRYITQKIWFEQKKTVFCFSERPYISIEMLFNHRKLCKVFFSDSDVKLNMKDFFYDHFWSFF
jgi:hypothetical protein